MRAVTCFLLIAFAGCYNPSLVSGGFKCGDQGACPEGLSCRDGLCVDPNRTPPPNPGADLRAGVPADLSGPPADMSPLADLSAGPAPDLLVTPCSPTATAMKQVGDGVYTCTGMFDSGQAGTLCGTGYQLCRSGTGIKMDCGMGFFVSAVRLSYDIMGANHDINMGTVSCGHTDQPIKALLGCGMVMPPMLGAACSGMKVQVGCSSPVNNKVPGWTCTDGFSDAANTGSQGGALCCQM